MAQERRPSDNLYVVARLAPTRKRFTNRERRDIQQAECAEEA